MLAEQEEAHVAERSQLVSLEQDLQKQMEMKQVELVDSQNHLQQSQDQLMAVIQELLQLQVSPSHNWTMAPCQSTNTSGGSRPS